ncbi:tlde1 domain-containing protein [Rahnella sp. ChDrAdgB13]|uniref:tlde1 domain-containing protein n=1 Tax=Rahnella sp. ChDrAdgB13 TaxID=1850581 RepID=UPI001AD89379|nr:tlde1 domain-containing protein [Rahnella sp. ChDrAdgB13]
MWEYDRASGSLKHNGTTISSGYSGKGKYKNRPEQEAYKAPHGSPNAAPLPAGSYTITSPFNSHVTGPYAMRLMPNSSNNMHGRGDFEIHGDKGSDPGNASEGCIVIAPSIRRQIWASGDRNLSVK